MIDDKGRIQTGTPAHRLQVLVIAASGAIVRPHAGDVLDACAECESRGNADERTEALFGEASAKIEQAEGRTGIAYAAKSDDVRHLLERLVAAPGSLEAEAQLENTAPTKAKKKKKGAGPEPEGDGGSAAGE